MNKKNIISTICSMMMAFSLFSENALPSGYSDYVGTSIKMMMPSSNSKQNVVLSWLTRDAHTWALLMCTDGERSHNYHVDVKIQNPNGEYVTVTNLSFAIDYHAPSDLVDFIVANDDGTTSKITLDKKCYYFPLDVTAMSNFEFGESAMVFLDCVEVGGGHDTEGLCSPVIPKNATLLTVRCTYDTNTVVEKVLVEIANVEQTETPQGLDRPDGEWVLTNATVNGASTPFDHDGTVTYTPVKGGLTSIEYFYEYIPKAVELWITDHYDAGSNEVFLAFKPTIERGLPLTRACITRNKDRFKIKFSEGTSNTNSLNSAELHPVSLRGADGSQDIDKGWVWIKYFNDNGVLDNVSDIETMWKIVIDYDE